MKLHASGEDYLEAVLVLQKEKGMVRSVDVARHMEVSKPSVCHAVTTLKKGGFLTMDEDFSLHLTDIGREVAEQTYEKHCFFTRQLVAAGVDPQTAEREACRMEHTIYMTVIFPSFPRRPCRVGIFGTLWVVISGISVRKPSSRKHLGDLSCLRCGVRLYCFMEQPIPRCLTVPWRRLPKNFLMPALSNWRGKSTHPPQSRTD